MIHKQSCKENEKRGESVLEENLKIEELPDLPENLKIAAEDNKLVIFIGAGISRYLGCSSWDDLARKLLNKCEKIGKINFLEKRSFLEYPNKKKIITICYDILPKKDFMDCMKEAFNNGAVNRSNPNLEIYEDLFKISNRFVTTNADLHVDQLFNDKRIKFNKFNEIGLEEDTILYKIHGSLEEEESLIFTTSSYISQYNNPKFIEFLKEMFARYHVLFVGYGLEEFEVLDHLMAKVNTTANARYYYVTGYFEHEEKIVNLDKKYFETMGIGLIPYQLNKKGYEQLKEVIKKWSKSVKRETLIMAKKYKEVDEFMESL